ncbi:2-C-methyl-D-erythritol 4-phosphate cytidylyltransferase, partial [Listeria monocytogenes]
RDNMYQGQTPQCFNMKKVYIHYLNLTPENKLILTVACIICLLAGDVVNFVIGVIFNIMITTPFVLYVAIAIIKERIDNV